MKKIIFTTIVILFLGIILSNAQNVNVDLTVKFNGDYKTDSVYIAFYPTVEVELGQRYPTIYKTFVISDLKKTLQIYPGAYTLGVMALGYKALKIPVFIPSDEKNQKMDIILNPEIIGWAFINNLNQIENVTLRFGSVQKKDEIPLSKKGNIWVLDRRPDLIKMGQNYLFYVNDMNTLDLLNHTVKPNWEWCALYNIYTGNSFTFDPSLYSLEYKESELIVSDTLQQYQFKQLVNEINPLEKVKNQIFRNTKSVDAALLSIDSLISKYTLIEKNYPPNLSQMIIDKKLGLLIFRYVASCPQGNRNDEQIKKAQKDYFLGDEPNNQFKQINTLLDKLDPNSFLISNDIVTFTILMQNHLDDFPEIAEKNNLSENYYQEYLDNFINSSANKKLCYSILMTQAYISQRKDATKTREILETIINNPLYEPFLNQKEIESLMAKLNISPGSLAPEFSVTTLNGKSIKLTDYLGKFVFLDFWGSWSAPCREEIPNIKKLYSSVSREKLEIIGLVQLYKDTETKLRDYIQEQKIEYPNALAPKELLEKYGISNYPTSFLINPKGKIVRIDAKGADAMEFIGEEIEDYFN